MINYIFGLEFDNSKEKEQAMMTISSNSNLSYGDVTPFEFEKDNQVFFYKLFATSDEKDNFEKDLENIKELLNEKGYAFKTKCLIADPILDIYRKDECEEFSKFNYIILNTNDNSIEMVEKLNDDNYDINKIREFVKKQNYKINIFTFTNFKTTYIRGLDYVSLSEEEKASGKFVVSTRIA